VLVLAATSGDSKILEELLAFGADVNNPRNAEAVRRGIECRRTECVRALSRILPRDFGCDGPGMTPVMKAIASLDMESTEFLLDQGFDVGHYSADGVCALGLACFQGALRASTAFWRGVVERICETLEAQGKPLDLPRDARGKGAVHWACESGSSEIVKIVCGRHCVRVNRVDQQGRTGLYCAIDKVNEATFIEMLQFLIDRGFKLEGETLTIVADLSCAMRPMYGAMEYLLQKGVDPLEDVPGSGKKVWQFFCKPHPRLHELFRRYCQPVLAGK
jgi:hypothetical protein